MKKLLVSLLIGLTALVPTFAWEYFQGSNNGRELVLDRKTVGIADIDGNDIDMIYGNIVLICYPETKDFTFEAVMMISGYDDVLEIVPEDVIFITDGGKVRDLYKTDIRYGGAHWGGTYARLMVSLINESKFSSIVFDIGEGHLVLFKIFEKGFLYESEAYRACFGE